METYGLKQFLCWTSKNERETKDDGGKRHQGSEGIRPVEDEQADEDDEYECHRYQDSI